MTSKNAAAGVLVLIAGVVAYYAYGAGENGPMLLFGHDDANRDAADAWHQLPVHAVLAGLLAFGAPRGSRLLTVAGVSGTALLLVWVGLLIAFGVGSMADGYWRLSDLLICLVLLAAYGGALFVTLNGDRFRGVAWVWAALSLACAAASLFPLWASVTFLLTPHSENLTVGIEGMTFNQASAAIGLVSLVVATGLFARRALAQRAQPEPGAKGS